MGRDPKHQSGLVGKPKVGRLMRGSGRVCRQFGFLAALALINFVSASDSSAETGVVHELAANVQKSKQKILEAETEKRRVLGSVYSIKQRIKKISHEKGRLTNELLHVQGNVRNLARLIAGLEVQIETQKLRLRKRLRALYKLSGQGYVGILFSRTSFVELDEAMKFLKIITEKDHQLIRSYRDNIAHYRSQRDKLKSEVERLVAIEKKIKGQESLLVSEQKAKAQIILDLDRARLANMDRIKTLRTRTQAVLKETEAERAEWAELLRPSIFERRGELSHPVDGELTQDFGLIVDERHKIQLSHKGWRYVASKGSPVSSIFDGKVAFLGRLSGYGETLIVDHGDHYYSVYAQIDRPKVKRGDILNTGQVIAEVGASAAWRRHGEGLYFELRHFSEPENPATWITRDRRDPRRTANRAARGPR